jgi:hypothetical protein
MTDRDTLLAFETLDDPPGVEVIDRIERFRYKLHTPDPVSPTEVETDDFLFPVDRAVSVTTEEIVMPLGRSVCVRNSEGEMLAEIEPMEEQSFEDGTYIVEPGTQINTYMLLSGPVDITVNLLETRISLRNSKSVRIGVVSGHDRPAATITTTEDPVDMMTAISTFGSALKATNPERAFPSNRGHPPAVRLGDELDVPEVVQPPETGIQLEIPTTYQAIYAVAPLAYYLGAEVVPGSTPRLITDTGFEHRLDSSKNLEKGIERTLKQVFLLDCVTRTEGVYDIELRERNELQQLFDFDWATLYNQPLAEQVAAYLDIPYALVSDTVPEWRLTVHVEPKSETVEHLPFVVSDLAIVRSASASPTAATAQPEPTTGFSRNDVITRSVADTNSMRGASYVQPESDSSLEQAWIGGSIPIGASKLTMEAFQNRLDRDANTGDISITIVLNDQRMDDERDIANRAYGDRDDLPFDVRICMDLTVEELRDLLQQENSFFHYIGHTEQDGFQCTDGKLDASTLNETGVNSFLLNACNSYEQGMCLIEAGAIGGIVTLSEVINDGAVRMGESIARLLNSGYPLRAALTIARDESVLGGQYIVVGDGGMTVTQAASRTPYLLDISKTDHGFAVDIDMYPTDDVGIGTVFKPHIAENNEYFLNSSTTRTFHVSEEELSTYLNLQNVPVRNGDNIYWSFSLAPNEID